MPKKRSLELIAAILLHTQEHDVAISNGSHALAIAVQLGGFDCAQAVSAHSSLAYILTGSADFLGSDLSDVTSDQMEDSITIPGAGARFFVKKL